MSARPAEEPSGSTLYETLGVDSSASSEQIRGAYISRIKAVHPDLNPGADDEAKLVNLAYEVLSDPARRAEYDRSLRGAPCPICAEPVPHDNEGVHLERHYAEAARVATACSVCGRAPTAQVAYRANAGFLLWRQVTAFEGPLCRNCAVGVYRLFQGRNLSRGWWGLLSFFATIGYLVMNRSELRKSEPLAAPEPGAPHDIEEQLRGDPISRQPGVWVAGAVLAAIGVGFAVEASPDRSFAPRSSGPATGSDQPIEWEAPPPQPSNQESVPLDGEVRPRCNANRVEAVLLRGARTHSRVVDRVNQFVDTGTWSFSPEGLRSDLRAAVRQLNRVERRHELSADGRRLVRATRNVLRHNIRLVGAASRLDIQTYNRLVDVQERLLQELRNVSESPFLFVCRA